MLLCAARGSSARRIRQNEQAIFLLSDSCLPGCLGGCLLADANAHAAPAHGDGLTKPANGDVIARACDRDEFAIPADHADPAT